MSTECQLCGGTGYRTRESAGYDVATPCACRHTRHGERRMERAGIPRRYLHCDLDSYDAMDPTQKRARTLARQFADAYPALDSGILFTGPCGVGKTHLAVGILRFLVGEKGVPGRFVDFRDLLRQIQESWHPSQTRSTSQVLRPVLDAEVLVLDDLGSSKPTDWVRDTVGHIINTRYNDQRITLFTTNFGDETPGRDDSTPGRDTLAERIGHPLRSRLAEMCRVIDIGGRDYRLAVRQAAYRW